MNRVPGVWRPRAHIWHPHPGVRAIDNFPRLLPFHGHRFALSMAHILTEKWEGERTREPV